MRCSFLMRCGTACAQTPKCREGCCTISFPFLLSFHFLSSLHAHHQCLFLLIEPAVGIFKRQRNSAEGSGEAAQAFTLWLTRMRMELHLQQLPSYGSAAAASAQGLVTNTQLETRFTIKVQILQKFILPVLAKSLDSCVVSSCLGFSSHLESNSKEKHPLHCSIVRIDTEKKQSCKGTLLQSQEP